MQELSPAAVTPAARPYTFTMTSRSFDPRHLAVEAFSKQAGVLAGDLPLAALVRLADSAAPEVTPSPADLVSWSAQGEARPVRGGEAPQTWLHVKATAPMAFTCQRCLQPVSVLLDIARSFRFVHGEQAAAQADAETEEDVLALTRSLDVIELLEDELLLAVPLVPRHETCPQPLQAPPDELIDAPQESPFAALAGLKVRRPLN
jgi:uncharacterized protein